MRVLGIHKDPWHDTGAAVIAGDRTATGFVNLAEERSNREKSTRQFPDLSIQACMRDIGIDSLQDFDLVVMDYIIRDDDWRKDYYKAPCRTDVLLKDIRPTRLHMVDHHLAHACNVFFSSPFKEAAILIIDGRGSKRQTQSLYKAGPSGIELLETTDEIGIGLLYAAVTHKLGFGHLQEGKTMGLAPYGAKVPGPILNFPSKYHGIITDYSSVCVNYTYDMTLEHKPLLGFSDQARAAYDVQVACESAMLHLTRHAREVTRSDYLCISGGVGLNSVANYKLLEAGLFKDIFINPAASDPGIPLGAALYGYHILGKQPKAYEEISPYLGPSYDDKAIRSAISGFGGRLKVVDSDAMGKTAEMLAANKIVGCFQGRSEMGPRALGNRSILMSPLVAENKDVLNHRVKHREGFRPFAPAVMVEHSEEFFEIDRPSPYMLMVPQVRAEKRHVIPATTHVDGSARLQTVSRDFNPRLYALIEAFYKRTGVPVLLNTSFNLAGEPIVETPTDAISCFLRTEMDALFIGDYMLVKAS